MYQKSAPSESGKTTDSVELGSSSNVRFGTFCFWLLSFLWAGWAGEGPFGAEAVHAVHRLAAKRTYAANSLLAFVFSFRVPSAGKRAISRGPWNRAMAPFQYSSTRMVLLAK